MEIEVPVTFAYIGRNFVDLSGASLDSSSSAFSDRNSDRSGEFPTASSQSLSLLIACFSDDLIRQLVRDLDSCCLDKQKQAALEIRLLAKNKPENSVRLTRADTIKPLISPTRVSLACPKS